MKTISTTFNILMIVIIYISAYFIQSQIFLTGDVSNAIHTAERFLSGGTYTNSFFENNPPWFIYCYIPLVVMAKLFSINYILTSRIYFFALSFLSLMACYRLIISITQLNPIYKKNILIPALVFISVFVPVFDFGQREHYMLILILPFLLATILRLENGQMTLSGGLFVGLLAGIGFCLKPYFLVTWLLVELFFYFQEDKKNGFKIRPETIMIILIILLYSFIIIGYHSDYLFYILPYAIHYFYAWFDVQNDNIIKQIAKHSFVICSMSLLFYWILLKNEQNKILETVIALAMIGFIFSYLIQKSSWQHYHIYPAFALGCFLLVQLCYRSCLLFFTKNKKQNFKEISISFTACITVMLVLAYPGYYIYSMCVDSINWRKHGEIAELNQHLQKFPAGSSIYFFSNALLPHPSVDYLNFISEQVIENYWYLPGVIAAHNQDEDILLKKVVDDFIIKKPDIIVFDNRIIWQGGFFDFLNYFSKDIRFRNALSHYRYIDGYKTIQIYQKNLT